MTEEKKLIIDEDWKSQVEAEKEAVAKGPAEGAEPAAAGQGDAPGPLPPASFEMLITSLATEAMMHLGQLPHPATGQQSVDLLNARFSIDLIEMLEEKTKGNLSEQEQRVATDILHQLRMAFVAVQSQASTAPPTEPKP